VIGKATLDELDTHTQKLNSFSKVYYLLEVVSRSLTSQITLPLVKFKVVWMKGRRRVKGMFVM
jgi:hypothetical protein